ncbi:MAG: hypothetical protein Q8Q10_03770 [bacterium]|nr:hypothetical protein [bacterium]
MLTEGGILRIRAAAAKAKEAARKAVGVELPNTVKPTDVPGAVNAPSGGGEAPTPSLSGVETAMFVPKPGAVDAPVGESVPVVIVEKKKMVRKPRVNSPAAGGDDSARAAVAKSRRVPKAAAPKPVNVATPPVRTDSARGRNTAHQKFTPENPDAFNAFNALLFTSANEKAFLGKLEEAKTLTEIGVLANKKRIKDEKTGVVEYKYRVVLKNWPPELREAFDKLKGTDRQAAELRLERMNHELGQVIAKKETAFLDRAADDMQKFFKKSSEAVALLAGEKDKIETEIPKAADKNALLNIGDERRVTVKGKKVLTRRFTSAGVLLPQYAGDTDALIFLNNLLERNPEIQKVESALYNQWNKQLNLLQTGGRGNGGGSANERLSIEKVQKRSEAWIQKTEALIPTLDDLDALKKITIFVGGDAKKRRSFNFPREFGSLFGKDALAEIKQSFSVALKDLMKLWQAQVVKVLFGMPDAESEFASFLQESHKTFGKKLNKAGFFRAYVEKFHRRFDELDDMIEPKRCKALQDKLYELFDKHFPVIETAQQAKGSGGKPEGKEPTDKELFVVLAKNLEGKPPIVGESGGELIVESVGQDMIAYKYRARGKRDWLKLKTKPDGARKLIKLLETGFGWKLPASPVEGGLDAAQQDPLWQEKTVKDYFEQPGVKEGFTKLMDSSFEELFDGRLKKKGLFNRYVERLNLTGIEGIEKPDRCEALQKKLDELWDEYLLRDEAELIPEPSSQKSDAPLGEEENRQERAVIDALTKQTRKWIFAFNTINKRDKFDILAQKAAEKGSTEGVPSFVVGTYLDALLKKYPLASGEDKEKITRLAQVFQDEIVEVYLKKGGKFDSEMREKAKLRYPEQKEKVRTYKELIALMDISEIDALAGITGKTLQLALEESRTAGKTKKTVIDEIGRDVVVKEILAPAISTASPSDWSAAEKEEFAQRFAQDRVDRFVQVRPKK